MGNMKKSLKMSAPLMYLPVVLCLFCIGCITMPPSYDPVIHQLQELRVAKAGKTGIHTSDIIGEWTQIRIRLPLDNGSYIVIYLEHKGDTFVGPDGEYYEELPSLEQLKKRYEETSWQQKSQLSQLNQLNQLNQLERNNLRKLLLRK